MSETPIEQVLCYVCGTLLDINGQPLPVDPSPESFPTLTPPSHTFTLTPDGLFEVGEVVSMVFHTEFSRGAINHSYGTNGYRSGKPVYYKYIGDGISGEWPSNDILTSTKNLTYTVSLGLQTWQSIVHYLGGDQPVGDKDSPYESPLPEGNTDPILVSATGVYPYFANTVDINTLTKQTLIMMNIPYVDITFVTEVGDSKEIVEFPNAWYSITGIEMYSADDWVWLNGSKENSLLSFTVTNVNNIIQGVSVGYKRFTHNGSRIGSRKLRFHTR